MGRNHKPGITQCEVPKTRSKTRFCSTWKPLERLR